MMKFTESVLNIVRLSPLYDWFGKRSYAQSGEDLIAWGEVEGGGFYAEVGAYHPKLFSNTYLFYKKGWRGICIEPSPTAGRLFAKARPRDVFVNCGVVDRLPRSARNDGRFEMEYFEFEDGAVNTFSPEQSEKNQKAGRKLIGKKMIPVMTLASILDRYLPKGQKIDLLSVDVEGMDLEVLQSNDWKKYRPRLIICEDLEFDLERYRGWIPDQVGNDKSGVVGFLNEVGYRLIAKTPYSLIFREKTVE